MDPAGFSPQWGITPEIEVILTLNLHDGDNAADIVPDSEVTYIGNSLIYVQEAEAVSMCNVTPSVTLSSLILGGRLVAKSKASSVQTAANLLNELEGSGLLGLPYAIALAGWGAVGCLVVVGTMAAFTGWCLARCMYDPNTHERVRSTYKSVGEACFGERGGRAVVIVQMLNLCSVGVVYLVLMSETLSELAPICNDRRVWAGICTAAVLPTVHIGGYKKLSVMSYLGLLCLATIIVLGISSSILQINNENGGNFKRMPLPSLSTFPASYSIFDFAFSAHGIFPDLEASMSQPKDFPAVVVSVFSLNMVMKVVFALSGFYAYGTAVSQVFTNSLPSTPRLAVSILIVLNTFLSFPLPLIPVFRFLKPRGNEFLHRTLIVLCIGAVSALVPNFGLAMGFMASLTLAFLTFIFPTLFLITIHGKDLGIATKCAAYLTMFMGGVGGVCGLIAKANLAVGT